MLLNLNPLGPLYSLVLFPSSWQSTIENKLLLMAKIGEKREYNVSDIEEGNSVCVHGIPMNLSPIKKSRKT